MTWTGSCKPGDLVVVTWEDSKNYEGWQHYHGAHIAHVRSSGWVLETDEALILTQTRADDDGETMVNGVIAIPWRCVVGVEVVRSAERGLDRHELD